MTIMKKWYWLIELLAGLLSGLLAALGGGLLVSLFSNNQGFGELAGFIGGMLFAFPLGVGGGMGYAAYRLRRHKRPFLAIIGAFIGILLVMLLAEPTGLNRNTTFLLFSTLLACCLSAWLALYLSGSRDQRVD